MEAIDQESVVAPGDIREAPVSMTTTDTNLTGNWKFFRPCAGEKFAPCTTACPLGNEIPDFLAELAREGPEAALQILRRRNPLPAVTGRVCPNFCQGQCTRKNRDQEVQIGCIERRLGDFGLDRPFPASYEARPERVAVIGSGPAGLAAAFFLSSAGLGVTVFEKESRAGGLLRYGIPAYRLPRNVLDAEIDNLFGSLNIDLRVNTPIDEKNISGLTKDFDFVFCAPGLGKSALPKEFRNRGERFVPGLELLHRLNMEEIPSGKRFAVIGGGNVAVDVARSLVRCGKEVQIIYRRTFEEMPAYPDEKSQALEEGIVLRERRVIKTAEPAESGMKLALAIAEKHGDSIRAGQAAEEVEVDFVIPAIGQEAHMSVPEAEKIFSGGDFITGPATVVEAMATGRNASKNILEEIDPDLSARIFPEESDLPTLDSGEVNLDFESASSGIEPGELDPETRKDSFAEVVSGLSMEQSKEAASRCLGCGTCNGCAICWFFCPDVAINMAEGPDGIRPEIDLQHCKGCGLCAAVCPRGIIRLEEET